MTPKDRSLQFASLNWDTSSEEMFPCLASGGVVIFRSNEIVEPFHKLIELSLREQITVWNFPMTYWHEFLDFLIEKKIALPESLRLVIIGGEKTTKKKIGLWMKHFGSKVKLLNTYGTTEATSISAAIPLNEWMGEEEEVPVGKSIGNGNLYTLSPHFTSLPRGVRGDLYIGGSGLAREYLNLPELNAEKFMQHPVTGERLFKTGDSAFKGLDDNYYLTGRGDTQIKRRGFRIELGELQTLIEEIEGVLESVVKFQNGELNAYVLSKGNLSVGVIRDHLSVVCPTYLFPDHIVMLDSFPHLPNGKKDLHALVVPKSQNTSAIDIEENLSETEKKILNLWIEILGHNHIQKEDNFFTVGGNSLLIIKLHSRLNELFGLDVSVSDLFRYTSCASQAKFFDKQKNENEIPSPLELLKKLSEGSIDLETIKRAFK
jgi:acyl-coenzyme A synthetase/AMP-(fatty) acid ligase